MEKFKVTFYYMGVRQQEMVVAETLFKAEKDIKEKYGKENVKISSVASVNNRW